MTPSRLRHCLRVSLAVATAFALPGLVTAQTPACRIPDFPAPTLCARAGLDTVHARYTIVVDESRSMQSLWPAVKQALAEFAGAVPEGDVLAVELFADRARTLIPPMPADERTRSSWQQSFASLTAPAGTSTDLGRAAETALRALRAEPVDRLQFVFFLTDGIHQPPAGSPYPSVWGGDWTGLDATTVLGARPVKVAVLRLTPQADRSFLTRVYPTAVSVDVTSPEALRAWFADARRQVAVSKLRLLIDRELARPAARLGATEALSVFTGRATTVELEVSSRRHIVETMLADSDPVAFPGGGTITPSRAMFLPGAAAHATARLQGPDCPVWMPPGSCSRTARGSVPIHTRLEPAAELARIDVRPDARADSLGVQLTIAGGGALPAAIYYPLAAALIALAAYALLLLKWRAHRPALAGTLRLTPVAANGGVGDPVDFRIDGLRSADATHPGDSGRVLLHLDARSRRGRTVVVAWPGAGQQVKLRSKPLVTEVELTGPTRFETDAGSILYTPRN